MPRSTKARQHDETDQIVRRPYTRMLIPDVEDGGYTARVLEFPGSISEGETPDQAVAKLEDALRGVVRTMLGRNNPIPEPRSAGMIAGDA